VCGPRSYLANEEKYKEIKAEILGGSSSEGEEASDEEASGSESEEDGEAAPSAATKESMDIQDMTLTNLTTLRKQIYLTIMSSLDFEECAHKMLKLTIKPGQENELANMIIECCSQVGPCALPCLVLCACHGSRFFVANSTIIQPKFFARFGCAGMGAGVQIFRYLTRG